jgi:hypothetical protein
LSAAKRRKKRKKIGRSFLRLLRFIAATEKVPYGSYDRTVLDFHRVHPWFQRP